MQKPVALLLMAFLLVLAFIPAYGDDALGGTPLSDTYSHLCAVASGFFSPGRHHGWTVFCSPGLSCRLPQIASSEADSRAPPVPA